MDQERHQEEMSMDAGKDIGPTERLLQTKKHVIQNKMTALEVQMLATRFGFVLTKVVSHMNVGAAVRAFCVRSPPLATTLHEHFPQHFSVLH